MIISNKPIQNVLKVYEKQNQVTTATTDKMQSKQGKDEFILSSGSQEFGQFFNAIRGLSDVRQEKVDEFSSEITTGTYNVDSKSVAEKMLGGYIS